MDRLFRSFSKVFIIAIVVKIVDVVRNLVVASYLGVSGHADIYLGIISIPDSILIIAGFDTIRGVVNSEYSGLFSAGDNNDIWESFSNLFNLILISGFIVTFVLYIYRSSVVSIFLPGFDEEKKILAISMTTIIFPIFFLKALIGLFQAVLNSQKKFYSPVLLMSLVSICILFSVLFPYIQNELLYNLSFGNLIGNIFVCVGLGWIIFQNGGKIKIGKLHFDKLTKKVIKSCFAILVLVLFNQLYLSSRNFFASFCEDGAISSLNYSAAITNLICILIFTTVFGILVSDLSSSFVTEKRILSKRLFINTLNTLLFIIVPIVIILLINRREVLELLYLRGNLDKIGIEKLITPFTWETLGIISFILYTIPTALFLAKKEYKLITKIGSLIFISGIIMNYFFSNIFGYSGISMVTFIIHFIYGFFLLIYAQRILGKLSSNIKPMIMIVMSGVIVWIVLFLFKLLVFDAFLSLYLKNIIITLVMNVFICLILYYLITSFLKVNYAAKWKNKYFLLKKDGVSN